MGPSNSGRARTAPCSVVVVAFGRQERQGADDQDDEGKEDPE
jgi:hypothetical protein